MAADMSPARYAQFRLISQVLQAAQYAGVMNASDAAAEFDALQREISSPPTKHWVDEIIETEAAIYAEVAL